MVVWRNPPPMYIYTLEYDAFRDLSWTSGNGVPQSDKNN